MADEKVVESKAEKKLISKEALAEIEAMVKTAVDRSPGDFLIGMYQDQETEGSPKYNVFLTARLASKKKRREKRIITL